MDKLRRVLGGVDTFSKWLGYCVAPFCVTLIAVTIYDIIGRQCGLFTAAAFDIEWFHNAFILMLAMGYTFGRGQHVRIDLVTGRLSPWSQAVLTAFSYAVIVIPLMILVAIYSWNFAMGARAVNEMVTTAWTFPLWPIKFFVPMGVGLVLPQCFADLIRNIWFVIKKEEL